MEKHQKTIGVVLAEYAYGENGKRLSLLTKELGRVTAFAKGAKKAKSPLLAASQLFVFANFELYKGKEAYTLTGAEVIESFYSIRSQIELTAMAAYFSELSLNFTREEMGSQRLLKLIYLSFEEMEKARTPLQQLKAVFELKLLSLLGYLPEVSQCIGCGREEDLSAVSLPECGMVCLHCMTKKEEKVSKPVRQAMQYVQDSPVEKVFRFRLGDDYEMEFSRLASKIMSCHLDFPLKSERFLKEIGF